MFRIFSKLKLNFYVPSARNRDANVKSRKYDHNNRGVYDLEFQMRYTKPLSDPETTQKLFEKAPWLKLGA